MNYQKELIENINTVQLMYDKGVISPIIRSVRIHHLRDFADELTLNFSFPITIIVGQNGTGKTTLMRTIKSLANSGSPKDEFFETVIDSGGYENASYSINTTNGEISFSRKSFNKWEQNAGITPMPPIVHLQTKSVIGAIDQGLYYCNIGKKAVQEDRVEYIIKQTRKLKQNMLDKSGKKAKYSLSQNALAGLNYILQSEIQSIDVVKHKYFNGLWGKSYFFQDGKTYSEYNAGSGEFVIAAIVECTDKIAENSVLLLDEPEVSLHPGAQQRLMNYLLQMVIKKKLQIIITTHSPYIVDEFPKTAIRCLKKERNGVVYLIDHVFYKNAFLELQSNVDVKSIIVEDEMAKKILDAILKKEGLNQLIEIEYCAGGASNIKCQTILTYSKTNVSNRYVFMDGDQKPTEMPDYSRVPTEEIDDVFERITKVKTKNIQWGIDANRKGGRYDETQRQELIKKYLDYYKNNVYFLPRQIPEDIVYDETNLKTLLALETFPDVSSAPDSKAKIRKISEETKVKMESIVDLLVYYFVQNKNNDYQSILSDLRRISETK